MPSLRYGVKESLVIWVQQGRFHAVDVSFCVSGCSVDRLGGFEPAEYGGPSANGEDQKMIITGTVILTVTAAIDKRGCRPVLRAVAKAFSASTSGVTSGESASRSVLPWNQHQQGRRRPETDRIGFLRGRAMDAANAYIIAPTVHRM